MRWWVWEERPFFIERGDYLMPVLEVVVLCVDRDPTQVRKPIKLGVEVQVSTREEARALCVSMQRRTGIPVGWPGPELKASNWYQEGY